MEHSQLKAITKGQQSKQTVFSKRCISRSSAFSKRTLHSNMPSSLVPSTFSKHFRGERGCPWYGPSAHPGRHFATRTLQYKRAFGAGTRYASLDLFLGILQVGHGKSARSLSRPKFFHGRLRGMSVPKCLFFQDLEGLTEVFGRMSAGISGQMLPLWAEFSFGKP